MNTTQAPAASVRSISTALLIASAGWLPATEIAGNLLVHLKAEDFQPHLTFWTQSAELGNPAVGGVFRKTGGPTKQTISGLPAVVFDGKGDRFHGPNTTGSSLEAAGGPYSVEVCVYQGNSLWEETVVSWGYPGGPGGSLASFRHGLNKDWGAWGGWGGGADQGFAPAQNGQGSPPDDGKWHLITYVYDGSSKHVYIDGVLNDSEAAALDAHNGQPILIGAEWEHRTGVNTNFLSQFSGAIHELRIHSGALTAPQVLANFNEKTVPAPATASALRFPLHRWSFNKPAGPAPNGTTVEDSAGGGDAVVRGGISHGGTDASFDGTCLSLPGGSSASEPYVDFPNGIISAHQEISIEFWAAADGVRTWSRLLSVGTSGGQEITGPGGNFGGKAGFFLANNIGTLHDQVLNVTSANSPNGGTDRGTVLTAENGTVFHHVIRYKPDVQEWQWWRDGKLLAVVPDSNGPTVIDDIDNWFGRSGWSGNQNFEGRLYELRIYNYALSEAEIRGNTTAGPTTLTHRSFEWIPTAGGTYEWNNPANWFLRPGPGAKSPAKGGGADHPDGLGVAAAIEGDVQAGQIFNFSDSTELTTFIYGPNNEQDTELGSNNQSELNFTAPEGGAAVIAVREVSGPLNFNLRTNFLAPTTMTSHSNQPMFFHDGWTGNDSITKLGTGPVTVGGDLNNFDGAITIMEGDFALGNSQIPVSFDDFAATVEADASLRFGGSNDLTTTLQVDGPGHFVVTPNADLRVQNSFIGIQGNFEVRAGPGTFEIRDSDVGGPDVFSNYGETMFTGFTFAGIQDFVLRTGKTSVQDDAIIIAMNIVCHNASFELSGNANCTFGTFFAAPTAGSSARVSLRDSAVLSVTGSADCRLSDASEAYTYISVEDSSQCTVSNNFQPGATGNCAMDINGGMVDCGLFAAFGRFDDGFCVVNISEGGTLSATNPSAAAIFGEEGWCNANVYAGGEVDCVNLCFVGGQGGKGYLNMLGGVLRARGVYPHNNDGYQQVYCDGGKICSIADNDNFVENFDNSLVGPGGCEFDTCGYNIGINQQIDPLTGDGVSEIPVTSGGQGYKGPPVVVISGGGGVGATARAEIDDDGELISIVITCPGVDYTSPPSVTLKGGDCDVPAELGAPTLTPNLPDGGIRCSGGGSVSFNNDVNCNGVLNVENATCFVNGAYEGDCNVGEEGSLGGNGSCNGKVTTQADSVIAPGTSIGTWSSSGGVTLGGSLQIELDGATADRLDVGGTLDISAATATLDFVELSAPTAPVYVIATYGALVPANGPFGGGVTNLPDGYTLVYNHEGANQIALVAGGMSDYEQWVTGFGLDPTTDGAPGEDADMDGLTNDQEHAFGTDPADPGSLTTITEPLDTGESFTYTRRDPALTGRIYEIQTSIDLETWTVDAGAVQSPGPTDADGNQSVEVSLSAMPVGGRIFARVGASSP